MKYKFFIIDNGNKEQKIPPLNVVVQILDNLKEDNTECFKILFKGFYADGFNVRVLTEEEFKKIGGKI